MQQPSRPSFVAAALSALRRDQECAYEGADHGNAVRLVALLGALSSLLALTFLPIDPPDAAIGPAGWPLAGLIVALGFAMSVRLARRPPAGFAPLLAISYAGLAQIALLIWLAGGAGSQYTLLFLFWACSAMGVHPPRRALGFLLVTALLAAAPLVYGNADPGDAADVLASILLWAAIGTVMLTLMVTVRAQRVQLREDERRERELARVDALTGLGNRRALDEALAHELARSSRAQSTASVVLVDVDGLKAINDQFGHLEGDRCLVAVAGAIGSAIRSGDRAFRWGGDEFVVLLPDTGYAGADAAAAAICAEVMQTCSDSRGRPLAVSAGIAEAAGEGASADLMDRADVELLARKREKLAINAG